MAKSNARGAQGAGTIRQRPDGRWEARYVVGSDPGTGKQIRKSIYGATQSEVRTKLTEIVRSIDRNCYIDDDKRTISEYFNTWMTEYIEPVQKPYTIVSYKSIIKNHIVPNMGAVRLCDLTTEHIQRMVRKLVNDGKKPKTIKNIITVLSSALEQAVKSGTIERNPAKYVRIPSVRVKEIHPLTPAEIVDFVDAAQDSAYYTPLMCCLFLGLREGEALGLSWDSVDFENNKVTIERQLQKEKVKDGKFYIEYSTKNGKSRVLDMPDFIVDLMKEERQRQLLAQIAAGKAWNNCWNLCFTNKIGACVAPKNLWANYKKIAAKIGIPDSRVHDLRHTNATLALVNGDDIKTVQANMGHATAAFTLQRYVHASEQMKRASANRMQSFFENNVAKKA